MKRSTKLIYFGFGLGLGLMAREMWKNAEGLKHWAGPQALQLISRGASLEDLVAELEATGNRASQQLLEKMPTERNYKLLSHVIGIERWGQSRLEVALGERSFSMDEYNAYRPKIGISWNELQDEFVTTRKQTVELAKRLASQEGNNVTVMHNEFGELSVLHWLVYLRQHANSELWKMN